MERLTEQDFWEAYAEGAAPSAAASRRRRFVPAAVQRSYQDFLFWDVILPKYVPEGKGKRALEIGSAPGERMIRLQQRLGYEPFGVEYTAAGVAANRALFARHGVAPDHVIHADFFDAGFLDAHREAFDFVSSFGFIEHFEAPASVVARHLDLLKPGGTLLVSIPNYRGAMYRAWTRRFRPHLLPLHNFEIMQRDAFVTLFDDPALETRFCDFYGTFYLGLLGTDGQTKMRHLMPWIHRATPLVDVPMRILFGKRGWESEALSPFLLYIGRKRGLGE